MASPQCENGHVRIADELYEAILKADFSKRELLVVLTVIRKTYGYRKTMDRIAASQISALTGVADTHCRETLRNLKNQGVILEDQGRIGIQKDYDLWGGRKRSGPKRSGPKQSAKEDQIGPLGGPKRSEKEDQIGPHNKQTDNIQTTDSMSAREPHLDNEAPSEERKAETSKREPKPRRDSWTPPAHLNLDAWEEFEQHRREINKPLSDLARTKAANQLSSLNSDEQQRCIDLSIQARWAGLFPEKVKINGNATHRSTGQESRTERYARMQREAEERAAASYHAAGLG